MSSGPHVVALVPCFNGAARIQATVRALQGEPAVHQVVVIDDGSHDDSGRLAGEAGAKVVTLPDNRGKGAALTAGMKATPEATVYLLVDADTAETARGAVPLLDPVLAGEADLTIGTLPSAEGRGGFGLVKNTAVKGIRRACGLATVAPLSGQRAAIGDLLRQLRLDRRFGVEVGMTIDAVRSSARVVEISVQMDHEHKGKSVAGFAHRGRQGRDVVRALWPRLVSPVVRTLFLLLAAALVCATALVASQHHSDVEGRSLPRVDAVEVFAVPGLRWDDSAAIPEGFAAASVVTGRTDVPNRTLSTGNRDDGSQGPPEVEVTVLDSRSAPDIQALLGGANARNVVMVVGTSPGGDDALRPLFLAGGGITGTLTSPSTHRQGVVDLTDIAPTVLALKGALPSPDMVGAPVRFDPSAAPSAESRTDQNEVAQFYESLNPVVIAVYVMVQVALFALVLFGRHKRPWVVKTALAVAAFPTATYLVHLLTSSGSVGLAAWSALTAVVVGMIVVVSRLGTGGGTKALRRVLIAFLVLITADLLTGSHLQFGGVFGSSPLLGTRYYGLGNPATTLFLVAFVVWAALHVEASASQSGALRRIVLAGVAVTLLTGLPGLGADAGGLLVAGALTALLPVVLSGRRVSGKRAAIATAFGLLATAIMAFLDQMRTPDSQTHLGRFAQSVLDDGLAPIGEFVRTRVELNLLGYGFPFTLAVVALAAALLVMLLAGKGRNRLPLESVERTAVIAALATAFLLFLVNDSGIVVLALPAVFLVPLLVVMRSGSERKNSMEVSVL